MHFVEDDGVDRFQARIRKQARDEYSRCDKLDERFGARVPFAADRVADPVPYPAAVQGGKAPGRGSCGHAPRLGHNDTRPARRRG